MLLNNKFGVLSLLAIAGIIIIALFMLVPNNTGWAGPPKIEVYPVQENVGEYYGPYLPVSLKPDDQLLYLNATIFQVLHGHAWQNHGTEVNDAIRCLNDKGSTRSFRTFGFVGYDGKPTNTNLWLCFDGENWYSIVTTFLEKVGGNRIGNLITAYKVNPTLFPTIDDFITFIGTKWSAKEIAFAIEIGTVFLHPK